MGGKRIPPGFPNPQVEAETLNSVSSKETPVKAKGFVLGLPDKERPSPVKAPEILKVSESETKRQELTVGSDTGSEKSFQKASTTETDRNKLAKWQAQRIKEQIAQRSQRAKSEAPNPQSSNPEEDWNAPLAHSTQSHSRATESPKKSGQTPEKNQFGLPMDSSSKETVENQSKTGSKTSPKTKTAPSKARTTDKSGQKVDPIRLRRIENGFQIATEQPSNIRKTQKRLREEQHLDQTIESVASGNLGAGPMTKRQITVAMNELIDQLATMATPVLTNQLVMPARLIVKNYKNRKVERDRSKTERCKVVFLPLA